MWTDADTRALHRIAYAWDHAELDLIPPCRFIEELATPLPVRRRVVRAAGPPVAPPLPPEPPPTITVERRLLRWFVGSLLVLGAVWVLVVAIGRYGLIRYRPVHPWRFIRIGNPDESAQVHASSRATSRATSTVSCRSG